MADFPVALPPSVDDALDKIRVRYDKLNSEDFIKHLNTKVDHEFVLVFERLPLILHNYLFSGILNNAGSYRSQSDPGGDTVFFGPRQQFSGYQAKKIAEGVKKAVECLEKNSDDPVYRG